MMINKHKLFCILLGLITVTTHGFETGNRKDNGSKQSAIDLVNQYYKHMSFGMPYEDLKHYWSKRKLNQFKELAQTLTRMNGTDFTIETQHILDLYHIGARCETKTFLEGDTFSERPRKAKFIYSIVNHCDKRSKDFKRTIRLRYSKTKSKWKIDKINEE